MPRSHKPVSIGAIVCLSLCLLSARAEIPEAAANGTGPAALKLWQDFLSKYIDTATADRINRIDYASVSPADRDSLEAFLRLQETVKVSGLPRGEQKAFWINLYNAQVIAVVLRHYPLKSIMDIRLPGSPPGKGPFVAKLLRVEGDSLSLDDIESGILRPKWRDPRIHFALNCASIGCPNLAAEAFTAENVDRLMKKSAHAFLGTPRGAAFQGPTLRLSSVFEWYPEDFGRKDAVVLGLLANYADPGLKSRLQTYTGKITYQYDWTLNDARRIPDGAQP